MRVLHLTTHLNIGGITTYIERLIQPLKDLGIDTFVLSSGGERAEDFRAKGSPVFTLPIKTKNELHPKLLCALPQLIRYLRENQIDLMHAHTRVTQVLAAAASLVTGVPWVTTCHGFFKPRLGRRLFPCWGRKVIAISPQVQEHLKQDFHVPESQTALISNAIDIEDLQKKHSEHAPAEAKVFYGFPADAKVVGIISRLVADKGHDDLIQAFSVLAPQYAGLRLLIVGEGKHRLELEKLAAALHIESKVKFTGALGDISRPLAAMDLFVLPATWREGFGLSVIEAMACRKPVIVSDVWSLNTLVQNEVNGLVTPPKQSGSLAQAITKLLECPEFGRGMALEAERRIQKEFTLTRMAEEIRQVYTKSLSKDPLKTL